MCGTGDLERNCHAPPPTTSLLDHLRRTPRRAAARRDRMQPRRPGRRHRVAARQPLCRCDARGEQRLVRRRGHLPRDGERLGYRDPPARRRRTLLGRRRRNLVRVRRRRERLTQPGAAPVAPGRTARGHRPRHRLRHLRHRRREDHRRGVQPRTSGLRQLRRHRTTRRRRRAPRAARRVLPIPLRHRHRSHRRLDRTGRRRSDRPPRRTRAADVRRRPRGDELLRPRACLGPRRHLVGGRLRRRSPDPAIRQVLATGSDAGIRQPVRDRRPDRSRRPGVG
ncbi:hypothetical protein MLGJGCBP_01752 [Rhodococcus sp. T7]|nr:hypothetical protein MLGJGCBP_01752 [Rhodococcus sp. T7]